MHRSLLAETSQESKFLHIRETTESTKERTERTESSLIRDSVLTVETISLDDIEQPNFMDFPQDTISLKMRLLARTGMQAPECSLISVLTTRESIMSTNKPGFNSLIYEKSDHSYPVKTARNSKSKEISFMGEFWRTDDEMRRGYLDRLRGCKVIGPNIKKKHQSVVIADWDGVLFCGSDLEDLKSNQSTQAEKETLALLDKSISTLLAKAADFCPTFIITSYAETLVESRARIFLPCTFEVITNRKIEIVSIGNYTLKESQEMKKGWFYIKDKLDSTVGTNIIYVVDSQTKVDRISELKEYCGDPLIKVVKFKEYPKVNELIKQQRLLINEFENILFSLRSFTVHLAKKTQKK